MTQPENKRPMFSSYFSHPLLCEAGWTLNFIFSSVKQKPCLARLSLPGLSKAAVITLVNSFWKPWSSADACKTEGWAFAAPLLTGPCLSLTRDHPDTVAGWAARTWAVFFFSLWSSLSVLWPASMREMFNDVLSVSTRWPVHIHRD